MTSKNKTYKAFVSSTFIDLKDHRAHVINSLRNAGFFVDPMENWTAESDEPKKFSQDRLAGCDMCVLLVAFRRGFVPDDETRSITQLEYDSAVKQGVVILPFLLDENEPWPRKFDELDKDPELRKWRDHLGIKHGKELFKLDPRSIDMTGALGRWFAKKEGRSEPEMTEHIDWPPNKSPYRGLLWFNQEYAPLFFGRDREVNELVAKMNDPQGRVLLVIGASGSGKSSVVAAGLWQAFHQRRAMPGSAHWKWQRIQPSDGDTPCDALARGLKETFQLSVRPRLRTTGTTLRDLLSQHLSQGQELILFVDQFEELFTSNFKEPDIQSFLEQLISTAKDATNRLMVVATIRSEFLGKLEAYEPTLNLLNSPYRYHLGPVSPRMLQDMIEKPAETTGYTFEPGLVERILQDTGQEPGNLALVEYALKQLFDKRQDRTFTVEAYDAMGGVVGAIATNANKVLSGVDEEVRGAFDAVFAELVHLDRERPPTRRRAAVSTFSSNQAAIKLIDALAGQECRVLVTSGTGQEAIVEVAHEKLFTAWPELRDWIVDSEEGLRLIDYEEEAARRWHKTGRHLQELWRKERCEAVQRMLMRFKKTPSASLQKMMHPQEMLVELLNDASLSHQNRLLIGQKLAEFGDLRRGVGLQGDLPDVEWIEIPSGRIKIRYVNDSLEVKGFRIARYLVTNTQFDSFIKAEDGYQFEKWWRDIAKSDGNAESHWREANAPRETVSWYEAVAFCRWLSYRTRSTIRLPTEWEWQQAATGGNPERDFPWSGGWDDTRNNSSASGLDRTSAVGMYPNGATQQGVMDMAGNLWEWCQNKDEDRAAPESLEINDTGRRVLRGGSWNNFWTDLSLSYQHQLSAHADVRNDLIGFRLVQDLEP